MKRIIGESVTEKFHELLTILSSSLQPLFSP